MDREWKGFTPLKMEQAGANPGRPSSEDHPQPLGTPRGSSEATNIPSWQAGSRAESSVHDQQTCSQLPAPQVGLPSPPLLADDARAGTCPPGPFIIDEWYWSRCWWYTGRRHVCILMAVVRLHRGRCVHQLVEIVRCHVQPVTSSVCVKRVHTGTPQCKAVSQLDQRPSRTRRRWVSSLCPCLRVLSADRHHPSATILRLMAVCVNWGLGFVCTAVKALSLHKRGHMWRDDLIVKGALQVEIMSLCLSQARTVGTTCSLRVTRGL